MDVGYHVCPDNVHCGAEQGARGHSRPLSKAFEPWSSSTAGTFFALDLVLQDQLEETVFFVAHYMPQILKISRLMMYIIKAVSFAQNWLWVLLMLFLLTVRIVGGLLLV